MSVEFRRLLPGVYVGDEWRIERTGDAYRGFKWRIDRAGKSIGQEDTLAKARAAVENARRAIR